MNRILLAFAALTLAVVPTSSALADTFTFSFSGASFSGSGTFTATEVGSTDIYNITAVTGSVTDGFGSSNITALLGLNAFQGNDNKLIYPPTLFGTQFFDHDGVSFSLKNGNDINLNDTLGFENAVGGPARGFDVTEFDVVDVDKVATTPEPGSLMLLGTGVLGLAGAVRRRLAA